MLKIRDKNQYNLRLLKGFTFGVLTFILVLFSATSFANTKEDVRTHAGKIVFTKGAVSLVSKDKLIRILAKGAKIYTGEKIHTGDKAKAILKLIDGTQISLIENSDFMVQAISVEKNKEKAELQLLKGGMRTITGFINKNRANNFKLSTAIASIGIRGTDFTTYICEQDCKSEKDNINSINKTKILKEDTAVKARLIVKKGDVKAKNSTGKIRLLDKESPLYVGDTLLTGKKSIAVIVFKDNTRTTVQSNSEFLIEDYQYRPAEVAKNKASFKLIKGSMRFLTGKIGKLNRDKYAISTPTASIGIRGTGFDLSYSNPTYLALWNGSVNFVFAKGELLIKEGQVYFLANREAFAKLIKKMPVKFQRGPRPDSDEVSKKANLLYLFGSRDNQGEPGLYFLVTEGEIEIRNGNVVLNMGQGEAGYVGEHIAYRITEAPGFLLERFIPPNANVQQLNRVQLSPDLFDGIVYRDNGLICEIR